MILPSLDFVPYLFRMHETGQLQDAYYLNQSKLTFYYILVLDNGDYVSIERFAVFLLETVGNERLLSEEQQSFSLNFEAKRSTERLEICQRIKISRFCCRFLHFVYN